jgi:hypothetical protein
MIKLYCKSGDEQFVINKYSNFMYILIIQHCFIHIDMYLIINTIKHTFKSFLGV